MSDQPIRRKYPNNLGYVEQGFRACWYNTQDLVTAAKHLLDNGLHAPALSLSVLALEELGKLCAIDGLLFAKQDDQKTKMFKDATKSHDTKLGIIELFTLFLGNLVRIDPRYGHDHAYAMAAVINIRNLQADGNALLARLGPAGFRELDKWKQAGFYASNNDRGLVAPRESVDPSLAAVVYTLARRATTSIDFVVKGGNFERYFQQARDIRSKFTEAGHQELERLGGREAQRLFGEPEEGSPGATLAPDKP